MGKLKNIGDPQQIDLFLHTYNRKLTTHVKDLIVYVEKILEMYESRKKAGDKRAESVNRMCVRFLWTKFRDATQRDQIRILELC